MASHLRLCINIVLVLSCFQLFDKNWHKIQLSIRHDEVDLWLDCVLVTTVPLEPRGPIDVNGDILMGKTAEGETVPVSNQKILKP